MQSNTHIILNVQAPNVAVVVNAKQGDKLSRVITADLVDGDIPFVPPSGVAAVVRYFKPDNTIGFYDVTEDGAAAVVLDGSTATVTLAEQALTVPGNVYAEINFYTSTEKLTTFNFIVHVQKSAVSDQMIESTDYFSALTERINAVLGAATNPPYINETTKNWMIYSESTGEYEDSGFSSIGLIPPSSVTYQAGTSGTTPPTGTWATSIPEVLQGDYLWTRTQFEFSDGTKQVSYSVARQGIDGTGSVRTVNDNSPDATGNVYVMNVNPNLLDNWYFGNPVNQRGALEYSGAGYTIDRWKLINAGGTLTVNDGSITLLRGESSTALLRQIIEKSTQYYGKTVTISALTASGVLVSKTGVIPSTNPSADSAFALANFDPDSYIAGLLNTDGNLFIQFKFTAQSPVEVVAAKLELGDTQTLAHKDSSGNWVLNEIPNYAEQLAKCQRYYFSSSGRYFNIGFAGATSTTEAYLTISLPVPMRKTPSITNAGAFVLRGNGAEKTVSSYDSVSMFNSFVYLKLTASDLVGYETYVVRTTGIVEFIADL